MKTQKTTIPNDFAESKKKPKIKLGNKFVFLIVLYVYLIPITLGLLGVDKANFRYFIAVSSFLLAVTSIIFLGPHQLETFRDHFSLWVIVFACFFLAIFAGDNKLIYKILFIILGVTLSIYTIINRKEIKIPDLNSFFIGLFSSIGAVAVIVLISTALAANFFANYPIYYSVPVIVKVFLSEFSLVSVTEEVLFRGLIFNLLVMNGSKENKALFIQAILFWGIHYADITNPVQFFILIPLGTIFMTLIIKKYRMLYLSVMMHTFLNVFPTLIVQYLFLIK